MTPDEFNKLPAVVRRFLLIRNSRLSIQEKWILEVLNNHQGDNPDCWLLLKTLEAECSLEARQIRRYIRKLEDDKFLKTTYRHMKSSTFEVLEDGLADLVTPSDIEDREPSDMEDRPAGHERPTPSDTEDRQLRRTSGTARTHPNPSIKPPSNPEKAEEGRSNERRGVGTLQRSTPSPANIGDVPAEIKITWMKEATSDAEPSLAANHLTGGNPFTFVNKLPAHVIAIRLVKLYQGILNDTGHKVTDLTLVDAINDPDFSGAHSLSWGLLTSPNFLKRFETAIRKRLPAPTTYTSNPNYNRFGIDDEESAPLGAEW